MHADHVLGDVHPYYADEKWYLFYLLPGGKYEAALMVSDDLMHWREVRLRHEGPPSEKPYFVLGVFQTADGKYRSYHGSLYGVMKAQESDDLLVWRNSPVERDIPPQRTLFEGQRDPWVTWNPDDGEFWCVMTCKVVGGPPGRNGAVGLASSSDLTDWRGRGILYHPGDIGEPEVPQLFKIGATWYLLASVYDAVRGVGRPSYWHGVGPAGPWAAAVPDSLDGEDLCAAQVAFDGARWILAGWIPLTTGRTWGGHLGLPREVYALPDGSLAARLEPGVARYARGPRLFPVAGRDAVRGRGPGWSRDEHTLRLTGRADRAAAATLDGVYGRFDLELSIEADGDATEAGVTLAAPGATAPVEVVVAGNGGARRLIVRSPEVQAEIQLRPAEPLRYDLRILAEGDIVEVFVNDRYSLAARIPFVIRKGTLGLTAAGRVQFSRVSIFTLNSL
jgi:hypothetical protein